MDRGNRKEEQKKMKNKPKKEIKKKCAHCGEKHIKLVNVHADKLDIKKFKKESKKNREEFINESRLRGFWIHNNNECDFIPLSSKIKYALMAHFDKNKKVDYWYFEIKSKNLETLGDMFKGYCKVDKKKKNKK